MTCLLGCGSVWLLLNTIIIHVCKGQVTYFLTTAIMSKNLLLAGLSVPVYCHCLLHVSLRRRCYCRADHRSFRNTYV